MRKSLFRFCLLVLFSLLFSRICQSQSANDAATEQKIREVETNITGRLLLNDEKPSTIPERMAKYGVKGLSIAVIHDYKIAWAKGYGWANEAEKKPVTPETLFEPGSISKTLNAVGILKLAQEKKLDLYTDINIYLKSWKFPYDTVSHGKKITLAHLLSHTAGLSVHGFPGHDIKGPIPTIYQVLNGEKPSFTPAVRSEFEPGLRFQYSGGGTSISQVILSDLVGQPYEVWMDKNVLKPIGMTNSTYAQPPAQALWEKCATAYKNDGTPLEGKFHVYPEQAAAGLWMTPSDLCRYILDIQGALKGKPSKVLSPEMVKLHITPYLNESAAMGTFIQNLEGATYFEHGAGNDGFCGQFYGSMEKGYGVAIFLNSSNGRILSEVINSVAKAYNWDHFYKAPERKSVISVDEATLQRYEGIYLFDNNWAAIGKKDNTHHFYTSQTYAKMYFTSPFSFFNEEFPAIKTMLKNDKGQVVGYSRMVTGKKFPDARRVENPDTVKLPPGPFMEIGWYFFEIRELAKSLQWFQRGVALHPKDLNLKINLAHIYAFHNEPDKAKEIYRTHLKDQIKPGFTCADLMKEEYQYLKAEKYDVSPLEKIYAELGVKWE